MVWAVATNEQLTSVARFNVLPSNFTVRLEADVAVVALLPLIVAVFPAADDILQVSQVNLLLGVFISEI